MDSSRVRCRQCERLPEARGERASSRALVELENRSVQLTTRSKRPATRFSRDQNAASDHFWLAHMTARRPSLAATGIVLYRRTSWPEPAFVGGPWPICARSHPLGRARHVGGPAESRRGRARRDVNPKALQCAGRSFACRGARWPDQFRGKANGGHRADLYAMTAFNRFYRTRHVSKIR